MLRTPPIWYCLEGTIHERWNGCFLISDWGMELRRNIECWNAHYLPCLGFLCLDRLQAPHLCSTHGPSQVIAGDNIWCIIHSESLRSNRELTPQNSDFRHGDYPHTRVWQHPHLASAYFTTCLSVPLHCQPKNGGASSSLLNLLWHITARNISI